MIAIALVAVANHLGIHQPEEWGWWALPLLAIITFNVALFEKTN